MAQRVAAVRDRFQARVILRAPAGELAARLTYPRGTLEPIGADSCLLSIGGEWLDGIALYVAGIGVDFEVLEPPELVARFAVLADRFTRAAAASPP